MVAYSAEGLSAMQARAYAQRFERGMILYTWLPRLHAPNQWFVLFQDGEQTQYWSFLVPMSLLGPAAPAYRPGAYAPPSGYHLPAPGFGMVWAALKDLLGWALGPIESYEFAYEPAGSGDPYAPPASLIAPNGMRILLHEDRTWEIETPEGVPFAA